MKTNRFINATQAGDYAVIVSRGNCKDTSDCVNISLTSLSESAASKVMIYPNPVANVMHFDASYLLNEVTFYSLNGTLIKKAFIENNELNCSTLKAGIYLAEIKIGNSKSRIKFIKQ